MATGKHEEIKQMVRAGRRDEARTALEAIVKADPSDADAWYGLYQLNDNPDQKRYCLQRAHALRPGPQTAQLLRKYSSPKTIQRKWILGVGVVLTPVFTCLCLLVIGTITEPTELITATAPAAIEPDPATATSVFVSFPPTWTPTESTIPIFTPEISSTPAVFFTANVPPSLTPMPFNPPTRNRQGIICDCSRDRLNCGDFAHQTAAQACFDFCLQSGKGDVHGLDGDNDGLACDDI